jgi:hypothetical protein
MRFVYIHNADRITRIIEHAIVFSCDSDGSSYETIIKFISRENSLRHKFIAKQRLAPR